MGLREPSIANATIAKVQEVRSGSETRRGAGLGTPAYMSPEQALGNVQAISVRTDIYALGVIGYETAN